MTEKTFTEKEINQITNKLFLSYHKIFEADKMSFHDWILIKAVIEEIQVAISEVMWNDN